MLTRTIQIPYNDPTNPFVHQYHPDHDNKDARFENIPLPSNTTATATATLVNGHQVGPITVTDGGSGYETAPAVTVAPPPSGQTAVVTATVTGGRVTALTVVNPGAGYEVTPPAITIAAPPAVTATTVTMADGVEAPAITRSCEFTFTTSPPLGSTVSSGWGSTVIGGTYREIISGVHRDPLQVDGTFELRRASEDGVLVTGP